MLIYIEDEPNKETEVLEKENHCVWKEKVDGYTAR